VQLFTHSLPSYFTRRTLFPSIMLPVSVKPSDPPVLSTILKLKLRDPDGSGYARAFLMEIPDRWCGRCRQAGDRGPPSFPVKSAAKHGTASSRSKAVQRDFHSGRRVQQSNIGSKCFVGAIISAFLKNVFRKT